MSARAVNVAILLLLVCEFASGLGGFLISAPDGRWLFWFHRAGGLGLVVLLAWKAGIAPRSYRRRDLGVGTGLSAVGDELFLGSLATGLLWATVGLPRIPMPIFGSWTVLNLHVALSLLLIPLFLTHVGLRYARACRADLIGRRAALRLLVLLAAGLVLWRVQEIYSAPRHRFARGGELRRQPPSRNRLAHRPDPSDGPRPLAALGPRRGRARVLPLLRVSPGLPRRRPTCRTRLHRRLVHGPALGRYAGGRLAGAGWSLGRRAEPSLSLRHRLRPPLPAGRGRRRLDREGSLT